MKNMEQYRISTGPEFELASRIASAMTGTNFFTHLFGCFLMTANRYTAACHPNFYEKVGESYLPSDDFKTSQKDSSQRGAPGEPFINGS